MLAHSAEFCRFQLRVKHTVHCRAVLSRVLMICAVYVAEGFGGREKCTTGKMNRGNKPSLTGEALSRYRKMYPLLNTAEWSGLLIVFAFTRTSSSASICQTDPIGHGFQLFDLCSQASSVLKLRILTRSHSNGPCKARQQSAIATRNKRLERTT